MPLQHATLMPTPEGVPEELHVACAGRLAVLSVRSQTVTFGGQTMSASRFEAVCGKGDAKKWKSSLWAASPEGIPLQVLVSPFWLQPLHVMLWLASQQGPSKTCCMLHRCWVVFHSLAIAV